MGRLQDQIQADLADAMRAKDEVRKSSIRMLIAALKNAQIEARKELDDAAVLAVVQKQVKQRRESIIEFRKGNREDLARQEEAEIAVLGEYLPAQASREEIVEAARKVIAETGASGPRDMGKVMPPLSKQFGASADGRTISEVVKELLGP
ncbi:MAG: aspartyl-tRNA amidotransferase [Anaerolinea sp.]|nr:aspartyl-tRNA amidotransferase [Anaerolinea sp.]